MSKIMYKDRAYSGVVTDADMVNVNNGAGETKTVQEMLANKALYFTGVNISAGTNTTICTISNSKITEDHIVVNCTWANPSAITTTVTCTTTNGQLVLTGTCTSATTASLTLVKQDYIIANPN